MPRPVPVMGFIGGEVVRAEAGNVDEIECGPEENERCSRGSHAASCRLSPKRPSMRTALRLRIARLIKLQFEAAGNLEIRHQAVAVVGDWPGEFDAAALQFRHSLLDVIAVKGNVVGAGAAAVLVLGGVAAH